jgi:hypothetical protein
MSPSERVFLYCERGRSEALFAEPFNAASNAAFLLAALVALLLLLRRPKEMRSADHFLLIALVFVVGLGSLAFHLLADRASLLADVIPIDLFMLVYLGFALNRFLGVPPGWTVLTLIGFAAIVFLTMKLKCWGGGIGFPGSEVIGASECLNGSLAACHGDRRRIARRAEASGCPLHSLDGLDLRHLGDVPLSRPCALRRLPDPRAQDRHPFRLASVEWAGAIPPAQGES